MFRNCITVAMCAATLGNAGRPLAGDFEALSEGEMYTLNEERQIYPTNQRSDHGQVDIKNPTSLAVVVWAVDDSPKGTCARSDTREVCKTTAIYVAVSKETAPTWRYGFRTPVGFNWWVTDIQQAETCLRVTFAEELRQGEYNGTAWPRRQASACVGPEGLVETK